MNRRSFLSTLAAIPLVGPAAAMAANAAAQPCIVAAQSAVRITLPTGDGLRWTKYLLHCDGKTFSVHDGEWIEVL